ncbi:MAG: sel1 repeat family protein [Proteobacteria bacterium]|nr:sel1 repeat family protein [Pseudomonadota bacterium]
MTSARSDGEKGLLSSIAGFVFKPAFDAAEKGAKQGNPFEQFNLGLMYYKGRGTAQDYTKAVNWWRRAAEQGFTEALNNLGMSYGNGDGVEQDYVQAHKWFDLAASRHPPGRKRRNSERDRDFLAKKMTAAQIAEAQRLAGEWMAAFDNRENK